MTTDIPKGFCRAYQHKCPNCGAAWVSERRHDAPCSTCGFWRITTHEIAARLRGEEAKDARG